MVKKESDYRREMGIRLIMEGCKTMGWQCAIAQEEVDGKCPGIICGTETFLKDYTEAPADEGELEMEFDGDQTA